MLHARSGLPDASGMEHKHNLCGLGDFPIFTIALAHSRTCARLTIALARLRTGKAISKLPDDSMSMIDVRDCAAQHVAALEGEAHHGTAFPPL